MCESDVKCSMNLWTLLLSFWNMPGPSGKMIKTEWLEKSGHSGSRLTKFLWHITLLSLSLISWSNSRSFQHFFSPGSVNAVSSYLISHICLICQLIVQFNSQVKWNKSSRQSLLCQCPKCSWRDGRAGRCPIAWVEKKKKAFCNFS